MLDVVFARGRYVIGLGVGCRNHRGEVAIMRVGILAYVDGWLVRQLAVHMYTVEHNAKVLGLTTLVRATLRTSRAMQIQFAQQWKTIDDAKRQHT